MNYPKRQGKGNARITDIKNTGNHENSKQANFPSKGKLANTPVTLPNTPFSGSPSHEITQMRTALC